MMLKKIYISIAFSFMSITAWGASFDQLSNQLIHLNAQIKAVRLSWQRAEMTCRNAKKLFPAMLYQQAESLAQGLLTRRDVKTKMNQLVDQELEAMVIQLAPYKAISFLSDFFSNKIAALNKPLRLVCTAIANREYRLLLGRKLTIKVKELMMAIQEAQNRPI